MNLLDIIGLVVGLILTLFVFSYLLGDNPLYRIAVHLLVGVTAAYAAVVATRELLLPAFAQLTAGESGGLLVVVPPFLLGALLLFKLFRPTAWLGNSAVAALMGIGAAVALVGAIVGTLLPQITGGDYGGPGMSLLTAVLTVCVLIYFHFTGRVSASGQPVMPVWRKYPALVGQFTLTIMFAVVFAALFNTSLLLLAARLRYFADQIMNLLADLMA
jgi:hypothetical protein